MNVARNHFNVIGKCLGRFAPQIRTNRLKAKQPVTHWAVECSVTERKPASSDDVGNGIKGKFGDITIIRSQIIVLK